MIDNILLAPYYMALKFRHFLFDKGIRKSFPAGVPTISVGNVTVGGTGKTPHTEMLIRILLADDEWGKRNIAVLSRGYKRKSKGFQQVTEDGTAAFFGDEPLQIKRKFPRVTVAVDKDRIQGCGFLTDPRNLLSSKKAKKCIDKDLAPQDIIILDDAFQYRSLTPTVSIVLADYNRPVFKDHLMPVGRLRDLPERVHHADIVIVTKAPAFLDDKERNEYVSGLGFTGYDTTSCSAMSRDGKTVHVFFTKIRYCELEPVFPDVERRYAYSRQAILVTGIADDRQLAMYLGASYNVADRLSFPDHHAFTASDILKIGKAAGQHPTAVIVTTEKDSQRLMDCSEIPGTLRQRMFRIPITVDFLSGEEREVFTGLLKESLRG